MRAIGVDDDGSLHIRHLPDPQPGPGEVAIRIAAAGVNRADLLQRAGHYPPPPGASPVLGLECAGTITALGPAVTRWTVGDRVCALLTGGGYAEVAVVPAGQVLPVPDRLSWAEAAALPEAWVTAHGALRGDGSMVAGERVLLHAGASGVGTAALQLCRELGCDTFVTVGSAAKVARCVALGAAGGAVRHDGPWLDAVRAWAPEGVDVVLDPVGAPYLPDDQRVLAPGGRIVVLGLLGGRHAELDLGRLLVKRQRVVGTVLRSRSRAAKARLVADMEHEVWPWLRAGRIAPVLERTFPFEAADEAHALLHSNETVGKLVLTV